METGQGSQGWGGGEVILFLHKNPNVGLHPPPGGEGGQVPPTRPQVQICLKDSGWSQRCGQRSSQLPDDP